MQLTEIQLFEVCVVVGYASYSDCNEILQVQLYLKMLRLKHSDLTAAIYNVGSINNGESISLIHTTPIWHTK